MSIKTIFTGFSKWAKANQASDYFNLPKSERTHLGFWYLKPYALPMEGPELGMVLKNGQPGEGWLTWETKTKAQYPIQFWLRESFCGGIASNWRLLKHKWHYEVVCRVSPRQKWLTKKIPRTWMDKTELIPMTMFAMVVHIVEEENCFETINYNAHELDSQFGKNLAECYTFIKETLPDLEKRLNESYPKAFTGDFEVDYKLVNQYEKEIEEQTTKWLTWIVVNRAFFWT